MTEETTAQVIEVVANVQTDPVLYMILGLIVALLVLILLSSFFNRQVENMAYFITGFYIGLGAFAVPFLLAVGIRACLDILNM